MKIAFFEVQDWEKDLLPKHFPDAQYVEEKLTKDNADVYKDTEIISTFVYSNGSEQVLKNFPNLKCICTRSTGFDHIDLEYCKKNNIVVCNVPEYGSNTVAEHTFALMLSLTRKIYQSVNQAKHLNFEHDDIRGVDLWGKTLGIIGLGKIGKNVLRIARGFKMKVLVFNRSKDEKLMKKYRYEYVNLDTLLKQSDIITLHAPLTEDTKHLINKENIMELKKGCYIINTARGGLIETEALLLGLDKGIVAGIALDVLEEENDLNEEVTILTERFRKKSDLKTLVLDHLLINHHKVLITPHNAFNSIEALYRIDNTTIKNIESFLAGQPQNMVSQ